MRILILHANAGHGHRKVAEVLHHAFQKHALESDVKIFDALEFTAPAFRKSYPAVYFHMVKYAPALWGWCYETFDIAWVYACVRRVRSLINQFWGQRLLRFVIKEQPDLIIFTHFFSAELLATAKQKGLIHAKLLTVITDFFPHTFWVNPGTDNYWVMNESSKKALMSRGVAESAIVAGGIPVDPIFKPKGNKSEVIKKYGFSQNRLTILFSSGSFGLAPYGEILKHLEEFREQIQCFVVCGNNRIMKEELEGLKFNFPVKIFGFVNFMADLMEASDLILAKSGGATTVESLAKEIPMIVLHPIPGQETRNANFLREAGASFFMEEPHQIRPIIFTVLKYKDMVNKKRETIRRVARPNAAEDLVDFSLKSGNNS